MNLNAKIVTIALPERLKYAKSRVSETNFEEKWQECLDSEMVLDGNK